MGRRLKRFFDPLSTAWNGVISHKLRSFLTMLGIVIGVGAVITLMSVGKGSTQQILNNIQSIGANLMTVRGGNSFFGGVRGSVGGTATLTLEDSEAIAANIDNVSALSASSSTNLQLRFGSENLNSPVNGVAVPYFQINNLTIGSGTLFSEEEYQRSAKVAVIGPNVATTLFKQASPIGQQIRAGTMIVTVIGVLESKGGSFNSTDDAVFIPLTLLQQTVSQSRTAQGQKVVQLISLTVANDTAADQVKADITALLRTRHRLTAAAADDFNIQSMSDILATLTSTTSTVTLLLGAIAGISLLVGGIGVMNIMLVSVLERTREIGIRKALGAKQRDIWMQFLIEASFLALAGGIIGVAGGWGVSWLLNKMAVVSTIVTSDVVILAVSVSIGIGLFFGFYPAWNASRLNPIEALRSE